MKGKRPRDSQLIDKILVNPSDLNSDWSMHGGRLFYLMDLKAAIVARDHSGQICHTVSGSAFKFFAPINTDHELIIKARITKSWNTSMEVKVDAYRKSLAGAEERVVGIYLYFVAVKDGEVQEVPPVIPTTQSDRKEWQSADARREEVKDFIDRYIGNLKK